jgi:hypothetical protein
MNPDKLATFTRVSNSHELRECAVGLVAIESRLRKCQNPTERNALMAEHRRIEEMMANAESSPEFRNALAYNRIQYPQQVR